MLTIEQIQNLKIGDAITVDVTQPKRKRKVYENYTFVGKDSTGYLRLTKTQGRVIMVHNPLDDSLSIAQ